MCFTHSMALPEAVGSRDAWADAEVRGIARPAFKRYANARSRANTFAHARKAHNMLAIDHFVFGASDLATGQKWMEYALGLPSVGSGSHARMSTHNALWRLGTAYLEVIAIDPDAPKPTHPRWYGLDDAATKARISNAPKLLTWVVATPDMEATRITSTIDPGPALKFSRDDLHWQLTVPATGTPHHRGAFPSLIHWPEGVMSPAKTLEDQGLAIAEFKVSGTDILKAALADLNALPLATVFEQADQPTLSLTVQSPETGAVHLA